nr:hypothetical protein [Burkholderia pyrrocinia]
MVRARDAILTLGGAARSNVFTRILLATFGQVPWRAAPFMPIEFVLFPKWVPISMYKVAYWARTTMVPLLVLCSLKARAAIRATSRSASCSSRRRTRSATTSARARHAQALPRARPHGPSYRAADAEASAGSARSGMRKPGARNA